MWKLICWFTMIIVVAAAIGAMTSCGESAPSAAPSTPSAGDVTYKCKGCGKTATAAATASAPSC